MQTGWVQYLGFTADWMGTVPWAYCRLAGYSTLGLLQTGWVEYLEFTADWLGLGMRTLLGRYTEDWSRTEPFHITVWGRMTI